MEIHNVKNIGRSVKGDTCIFASRKKRAPSLTTILRKKCREWPILGSNENMIPIVRGNVGNSITWEERGVPSLAGISREPEGIVRISR